MLLLLRKLKHGYLSHAELRKYLVYSLGEIVLIIIGILIALQIDNWNTDEQQRESLQGYFHTISRNIDSDLASVDELRSERLRVYELSISWTEFEPINRPYTVRELMLASQVLNEASTLRHFNANSSGYEALKSSGILDQMQGTDIEELLFDYYDVVAQIARGEQDYNEFTRALSLQVLGRWPDDVEQWELASAAVLTADRFETSQPAYRRILRDNTMRQLLSRPLSAGALLRDYDKLDGLGRAFQHLVDTDSVALDDTAVSILDGIYDRRSGIGQPNVIVDGQVSWHSHHLINSNANDSRVGYAASAAELEGPFDTESFQKVGDSLRIRHRGGVAWAGLWFGVGTDVGNLSTADYSVYSKLVLELKGDAGGEQIIVNMEDRDDPADGTSTRYELQLSDDWQIYEIDLTEFKTADLSILSTPLGFVFFEEPVSFSVRTAKFITAD